MDDSAMTYPSYHRLRQQSVAPRPRPLVSYEERRRMRANHVTDRSDGSLSDSSNSSGSSSSSSTISISNISSSGHNSSASDSSDATVVDSPASPTSPAIFRPFPVRPALTRRPAVSRGFVPDPNVNALFRGFRTADVELLHSLCRIHRVERNERMTAIQNRLHQLRKPDWGICHFGHGTVSDVNLVTEGAADLAALGIDKIKFDTCGVVKMLEIPDELACSLKRTEMDRVHRALHDELDKLREQAAMERVHGFAYTIWLAQQDTGENAIFSSGTLAAGYSRFVAARAGEDPVGQKVQIRSLGPEQTSQIIAVVDPMEPDSRYTTPCSATRSVTFSASLTAKQSLQSLTPLPKTSSLLVTARHGVSIESDDGSKPSSSSSSRRRSWWSMLGSIFGLTRRRSSSSASMSSDDSGGARMPVYRPFTSMTYTSSHVVAPAPKRSAYLTASSMGGQRLMRSYRAVKENAN